MSKKVTKSNNGGELMGIEFIRNYDKNQNKYLPLIDKYTMIIPSKNEFGDINIGWNAGILESNRPFYSECWSTEGITMLTIFVSIIGIENISKKDLVKKILNIKYLKQKKGEMNPDILKFKDSTGNIFYSINILVGEPDEPAVIDGGEIYPFSILNKYNKKRKTQN